MAEAKIPIQRKGMCDLEKVTDRNLENLFQAAIGWKMCFSRRRD